MRADRISVLSTPDGCPMTAHQSCSIANAGWSGVPVIPRAGSPGIIITRDARYSHFYVRTCGATTTMSWNRRTAPPVAALCVLPADNKGGEGVTQGHPGMPTHLGSTDNVRGLAVPRDEIRARPLCKL